ncbi:MAG: DNA-binding protein [Myxococcales bacterium]|nr:DNA-binding protein [Myxococcales bacterium]
MATKKTAIKAMTKSELIEALAQAGGEGVTKQQVKGLLEALEQVGHKQLKKDGIFTLPGFAKFRVVKKGPTPARTGMNPLTGKETVYKAKPASKAVRARPVKACKDCIG